MVLDKPTAAWTLHPPLRKFVCWNWIPQSYGFRLGILLRWLSYWSRAIGNKIRGFIHETSETSLCLPTCRNKMTSLFSGSHEVSLQRSAFANLILTVQIIKQWQKNIWFISHHVYGILFVNLHKLRLPLNNPMFIINNCCLYLKYMGF